MNLKIIIIHGFLSIGICLSAAAGKGLPLRKFREPGDSLDISIQQEVDRAVDLGIGWIQAQQNIDGSWGWSNKLETTAICALALASQSNLELTNTLHAALHYIVSRSGEQRFEDFSAIAWSAAALRITGTTGCATEQSCAWLKNPKAPLLPVDASLQRELVLGLDLLEPDEAELAASQVHYSLLAQELNAENIGMLQMWLDARVINRVGKGQLINHGQRVDWRRVFARKIISTQKIEPLGGGFWSGASNSKVLQNTALAILILKEL